MSAEKNTSKTGSGGKRYTIRFEQEFHDKLLLAMAHKHVRYIQAAVHVALEEWMTGQKKTADAVHSPTVTLEPGEVLARLETIESLQRHIQDGVTKVLREITRTTPTERPIESLVQQVHDDLEDDLSDADREVLRRAAKLIEEHGEGSKYIAPVKKDRPRKQAQTPGTGTGGRKSGAR